MTFSVRCRLRAVLLTGGALALAFYLYGPARQVLLLMGGSATPAHGYGQLEATVRLGLLTVPVTADGRRLDMLFDTGAFQSKITESAATDLGLDAIVSKTNTDTFGREQRQAVTRLPPTRSGQLSFEDVAAGIVRYAEDSASRCVAPDGIVGGNWIRLANWEVDFARGVVTAYGRDLPLPVPEGAVAVPFSRPLLSGVPEVTLVVAGRSFEGVLLDTGANGGVTLPTSALEVLALEADDLLTVVDGASSGLYGTRQRTYQVAELPVAFSGTDPVSARITFTDDTTAKVGTEVLAHFRVFIDSAARRLHLAAADRPVGFARQPLRHGFLPGVTDDDQWTVAYLEQRAGVDPRLRAGDTFVRLDGRRPSEVFADFCAYATRARDVVDQPIIRLERSDGSVLVLGA